MVQEEPKVEAKDIGLICPDSLPDNLLRDLSHEQIQQVGYFLFAQLVKQRDVSLKAGKKEVVEHIQECEKRNPDFYSHIQVEKCYWQAKLKEWGIRKCARCGAIRTDDIDSDICGSCADDLRTEQEAREQGAKDG